MAVIKRIMPKIIARESNIVSDQYPSASPLETSTKKSTLYKIDFTPNLELVVLSSLDFMPLYSSFAFKKLSKNFHIHFIDGSFAITITPFCLLLSSTNFCKRTKDFQSLCTTHSRSHKQTQPLAPRQRAL